MSDIEKSWPSYKYAKSRKLIANFKNGFAEGWYFAVPEAYRDALDITQEERAVTLKHTEVGKDGSKTYRIEKHKEMTWVQGRNFSFKKGDVIYDTPKAYEEWSEALKHIKYSIQVTEAKPNTVDHDGPVAGMVRFDIYTPNRAKSGIDKVASREITQDEFVSLLKHGRLPTPINELLKQLQKGKKKQPDLF